MSLPATNDRLAAFNFDEHICITCSKTIGKTCARKRLVREGYCCEWIGGKQ
jgi:hypothetical protein